MHTEDVSHPAIPKPMGNIEEILSSLKPWEKVLNGTNIEFDLYPSEFKRHDA